VKPNLVILESMLKKSERLFFLVFLWCRTLTHLFLVKPSFVIIFVFLIQLMATWCNKSNSKTVCIYYIDICDVYTDKLP